MTTILVVDDSAVDRRLLSGILEKRNDFRVETVANGAEAVAKVRESLPDVVVTDLNMPEMDGLQLVTALRNLHPQIPVILTTANGSEGIAMEALEEGAASYVAKAQAAERLVASIDQVLQQVNVRSSYKKLSEAMTSAHFQYVLDGDESVHKNLLELVQHLAQGMQLCDPTEQVRMGLAFDEALRIAYYRGNLELTISEFDGLEMNQPAMLAKVDQRRRISPYRDRRLHVDVQINPQSATFQVRHEGPGLDDVALEDPHDPNAIKYSEQRGAVLMHLFMDDIQFGPSGEITLTKRKSDVLAAA
jgi:CheY-like chemotaxis protein